MNDEIGPECYRLLQGRRQKSVVHGDCCPCRLGLSRDGSDIDDTHERIAGSLDEHQFRLARRKGLIKSGGIVLVDENDFELAFAGAEVEQALSAAVTVMRRHNALARLKAGQDQIYGGHAARDDDSPRTALQLGERVGKLIARRIAGARIVISSGLLARYIGGATAPKSASWPMPLAAAMVRGDLLSVISLFPCVDSVPRLDQLLKSFPALTSFT
jgi:hypothetical protein